MCFIPRSLLQWQSEEFASGINAGQLVAQTNTSYALLARLAGKAEKHEHGIKRRGNANTRIYPCGAFAAVFARSFSHKLTLIRSHKLIARLHSADLLWFRATCSCRGLGSALPALIDLLAFICADSP